MLNVIIGEQEFSIRNQFDELTIQEFEQITKIVNNTELDIIEQYHAIFLLLGVDESSLDLINLEGFMGIIAKWEQRDQLSGFTRTITISGDTYAAYDEGKEFKFNLKLIREINKIAKEETLTYSKILAVVFQDIEKCKTQECFDYKSDIFNEVTCDIALPYILDYNDEIKNSLNSINV
jgi:hypothetical protein